AGQGSAGGDDRRRLGRRQRPEQPHAARGLRPGARQPLDRPRGGDAGHRRQRPARQRARPAQLHNRPRGGGGARPPGAVAGPRRPHARHLRSRLLGQRLPRLARRAAAAFRGRARDRVRDAGRRRAADRHQGAARSGAGGGNRGQTRPTMSRGRLLPAVAAVVVVALGAVGVWRIRSPRPPALAGGSCRGCNLLLVTIDTLRADRVGAFGSARGLTPRLDRLAAEGLRFTRAYTSAPLTLPAHASLLTSASPPVHGVRNNSLFRLGDNLPTLATVLKGAGYRTGAFVGAFVL